MAEGSFVYQAPAKVNLTLRVLRRRNDGFHEIETLMVPVSLSDALHFNPTDAGGVKFTCSDSTLPLGPDNLVLKAVSGFEKRTGRRLNVEIRLEKMIPHGAGLGGGSSDAATTLLALNEIFEGALGTSELSGIAAEIGSDIPFFIYRSAAWCRGRGEVVEPSAFPATIPLILLKPGFGVPTPWAYKMWRDSLEIPGIPYGPQTFEWGELVNDLERPVFQKYIQLAEMKRWLLGRPEVYGAIMSGSGSTMMAVLKSPNDAGELIRAARDVFGEGLWTCEVSTI